MVLPIRGSAQAKAYGSLGEMESAAERVLRFLPPVPCLMQLDWAAPLEGDVQIGVAGKKSGFGQRNEGVVADLGEQQWFGSDDVENWRPAGGCRISWSAY